MVNIRLIMVDGFHHGGPPKSWMVFVRKSPIQPSQTNMRSLKSHGAQSDELFFFGSKRDLELMNRGRGDGSDRGVWIDPQNASSIPSAACNFWELDPMLSRHPNCQAKWLGHVLQMKVLMSQSRWGVRSAFEGIGSWRLGCTEVGFDGGSMRTDGVKIGWIMRSFLMIANARRNVRVGNAFCRRKGHIGSKLPSSCVTNRDGCINIVQKCRDRCNESCKFEVTDARSLWEFTGN